MRSRVHLPAASPDAGFERDPARGWLAVLATFISTATIFGITYSFSTFLKSMANEFDADKSGIAFMFGLTIFCLFILGLPAGRICDVIGPRPVVLFGCATMVTGLWATSSVQSIGAGYLTYGLGVGVGVACCYVPLVTQVSGWFNRQRAMAVGLAVSGIGVGTLFGPPISAQLIELYGWRETFRILAATALIGLLLAAALVARAPATAAGTDFRLFSVFANPVFRFMYAGGFLMGLALFVPFVFLAPYAEDNGVSPQTAATLVSFLGVGSLLGRVALGLFVNRVGLLRLYQACFAILGISFLVWLACALWVPGSGQYPVLALFAFILGTSYGGYVALSPAAAAELFGLSGLGAVLGALYTSSGVGGLIGPPAAGWLIEETGRYESSIVAALVLGIGSVLMLRLAIKSHERIAPE